MANDFHERHSKNIELCEAIDRGELAMLYQPTFLLDTGKIVGAEALVRWNHPKRGMLLPKEFVGLAERNGLMGRLTRWVMGRVISDLSSMTSLPEGFRCYFNLATSQIDDLEFMAELEERLRSAPPHVARHLGIEITETAAFSNRESSMHTLEQFRRLGLRIAIDDFGTGYSSLSYLKHLPVDVIKIDRSFVAGLPEDSKDVALSELMLQIAARFDLITLAEGIETPKQLAWLREQGCDIGQGYFLARPQPFETLCERFQLNRRSNVHRRPEAVAR
jgi:EAL domain-containing protein (putative c-di-GMP-specific phosphodiesterase class I)